MKSRLIDFHDYRCDCYHISWTSTNKHPSHEAIAQAMLANMVKDDCVRSQGRIEEWGKDGTLTVTLFVNVKKS